jgi:hypothetical protein
VSKTTPVIASIVLAASALALGYGLNSAWAGVILIAATGFLWVLGQRRGWRWIAPCGLVCYVVIAGIGLGMRSWSSWMLIGMVAALSAWDLDHFVRRLRESGQIENAHALERRHFQRLLIVDSVSLLLGAVALGISLEFSFSIGLLLAVLATFGLTRAIGFLQRQDSDE